MTKNDHDLPLDEVSKACLKKYRMRAKAKMRAKTADDNAEPKKKAANESLSIIDGVMTQDEMGPEPYFHTMEERINLMVDVIKDKINQAMFDISGKQ